MQSEDGWNILKEVRGHHDECGQDREKQGKEEEGAEVERDLSELPSANNDNI